MKMIFPKNIFKTLLKQGKILFIKEFHFLNGDFKNKYAIVLNKNTTENDVYIILSTSQTEKYNQNKLLRDRLPYCVYLNAGDAFGKDTIFDTYNIIELEFDKLYEYHKTEDIKIEKQIPEPYVEELLEKIRKNPSLSKKLKQQIIDI